MRRKLFTYEAVISAVVVIASSALASGAAAAPATGAPTTTTPVTAMVGRTGAPGLPPHCAADGTLVSCTYSYDGTTGTDGTPQAFVVPVGVTTVTIEAWGAQGGNASTEDDVFSTPAVGGLGGYEKGTVTVAAGEDLSVRAGGQPTGPSGGFNGGGGAGPAAATGYDGAAGGGASDVRAGGDGLEDRLLVAGGGGGGANDDHLEHGDAIGGGGGGASGAQSSWCPNDGFLTTCGQGGTTTAGGAAGDSLSPCAADGGLGQGGSGCGGGGGGGYYGGGGGGFTEGTCCGSAPVPIDGPGGGGSGEAVPSATGVVALGGRQNGNGQVRISYTAAHRSAGLSWSAPRRIDAASRGLSAVSCADAAFCVAVDRAGRARVYTGTWSKPVTVADGALAAVSCANRSFCVAVGSATGPGQVGEPLIAVDTHGSWSSSTGPVSGTDENLSGVSCVSADFCVAAGTYQQGGAPGTTAFVQTFDGRTWTPVSQGLIGYYSGDSMQAVSCASRAFCAAGGTAGDRGDIGGLADVDTGGSWTGAQISDDRTQSGGDSGGLGAMACPAVHSCVAAGPDGYVFAYAGGGWVIGDGDPLAAIDSVSCPEAATCVAVDGAGDVVTRYAGLWEVPVDVDGGRSLSSISCPTRRFCLAVDTSGHALVGTRTGGVPG
jgi:hypothetical protein